MIVMELWISVGLFLTLMITLSVQSKVSSTESNLYKSFISTVIEGQNSIHSELEQINITKKYGQDDTNQIPFERKPGIRDTGQQMTTTKGLAKKFSFGSDNYTMPCAENFTRVNFIIKTKASLRRGALFIGSHGDEVTSEQDCIFKCCSHSNCNTLIIQSMMPGKVSCYLFDCGSSDVCLFSNSSSNVSVVKLSRDPAFSSVHHLQKAQSSELLDQSSSSSSDEEMLDHWLELYDDRDKVDDEETNGDWIDDKAKEEPDEGVWFKRRSEGNQNDSSSFSSNNSELTEHNIIDTIHVDLNTLAYYNTSNFNLIQPSEIVLVENSSNRTDDGTMQTQSAHYQQRNQTTLLAVIICALLVCMLICVIGYRTKSTACGKKKHYSKSMGKDADHLMGV